MNIESLKQEVASLKEKLALKETELQRAEENDLNPYKCGNIVDFTIKYCKFRGIIKHEEAIYCDILVIQSLECAEDCSERGRFSHIYILGHLKYINKDEITQTYSKKEYKNLLNEAKSNLSDQIKTLQEFYGTIYDNSLLYKD
jgi:hypothetical protein